MMKTEEVSFLKINKIIAERHADPSRISYFFPEEFSFYILVVYYISSFFRIPFLYLRYIILNILFYTLLSSPLSVFILRLLK